MTAETIDFWSGAFGDEYHKRNRVESQARMPFWESALDYTEAGSVLEVGCGPGWNLLAMQQIKPTLELAGIDVNDSAVNEAREQGLEVTRCDALGLHGLFGADRFDLVVTSGLLIHVPPVDLEAVMRSIMEVSAKYVLAVEYAAEQTEEVEYRGHSGKLWRRPFGRLYEALGLRLVSEGSAGGWDDCTYWLLDKG